MQCAECRECRRNSLVRHYKHKLNINYNVKFPFSANIVLFVLHSYGISDWNSDHNHIGRENDWIVYWAIYDDYERMIKSTGLEFGPLKLPHTFEYHLLYLLFIWAHFYTRGTLALQMRYIKMCAWARTIELNIYDNCEPNKILRNCLRFLFLFSYWNVIANRRSIYSTLMLQKNDLISFAHLIWMAIFNVPFTTMKIKMVFIIKIINSSSFGILAWDLRNAIFISLNYLISNK